MNSEKVALVMPIGTSRESKTFSAFVSIIDQGVSVLWRIDMLHPYAYAACR